MNTSQILPGSTICILGAGQLGKMSLIAAHQLGFKTMVWSPDSVPGVLDPAMAMATHRLRRPFSCQTTIDEVLKNAAVITTEWENIPITLIQELQRRGGIVRPGNLVLEFAQSRRHEKQMAVQLGIPVTRHIWIEQGGLRLEHNWAAYLPGILKTNKLGYDGKGQWSVNSVEELVSVFAQADTDCVLEKRVDFAAEVSVLVARNADGEIAVSDLVQNTHQDGILDTTVWPICSSKAITRQISVVVQEAAVHVAKYLVLKGILVLEFFITKTGQCLFNEVAPRPHNSFHGSIEAAHTSQFEQHIRAICNLPLGAVRFHTPFQMKNLIGGAWESDWVPWMSQSGSRLHLYGKEDSKPGRKMGHVTILRPSK